MSDLITARVVHGIGDEERELVEKVYRAIAGEPDLLDEVVSPEWEDLPSPPGAARGPDAFKPVIEMFHQKWQGATVAIHEMFGCPGHVAVRAEMSGVLVADWLGVPATNEHCSVQIHEFHQIEDGRIVRSWHMEDWIGWMRQVGAERLVP